MTDKPSRYFIIYLGILAIGGGMSVYLATSKMGPGVSTDAAVMLSTAENVAAGHGLVDYRGLILTQFPPLYSFILAVGALLFRQDVFTIGWALGVVVFAATIWFSGLYFYQAFRDVPTLAYMASSIIFSSTSLIKISANIASDPLFLLMVIFFLMLMSAYLATGHLRYLVLTAALTVGACFERYAGLSLVITGALIVAFANRRSLPDAIRLSIAFALLTGAPILLWGYLHNAPVSGNAFGGRLPSIPALNFTAGVEKILYWFIPLRIISLAGPLLLFGLIVLVLLVAVFLTRGMGTLRRLFSSVVFPNLVFLLVYAAVLTFDISYYELKGIGSDRVHVIILPSLLVVVLSIALPPLRAAMFRFGRRWIYGATLVVFLAWSVYPLAKTDEYVRESMRVGDVSSYNSINKANIRTSPLAHFLLSLDLQQKKVYTNGGDSAWFILHRQVDPTPMLRSDDRLASLQQQYAEWPGAGGNGYLIWFKSEAYKESYATPEELSSIAQLRQVYQDEKATVYYVSSR